MGIKIHFNMKIKTLSIFKLFFVIISLCLYSINTLHAQKDGFETKVLKLRESLKDSTHYTQADIDFAILDKMKSFFATREEGAKYDNASILEARKYEDKIFKNKMQLAVAFLNKYPQDKRYDKALGMFFNPYFDPLFIPETIVDNKVRFIDSIPVSSSSSLDKSKKHNYDMRKMNLDNKAMEQWLDKGNELVSNILVSNTSLERKEQCETYILFRDYRQALRWYHLMDRIPSEANYWEYVSKKYWDGFRLRFEAHLNRYGILEVTASRVQMFLQSLKTWCPYLIKPYWEYFFKITSSTNPLADQPAFKALHNMAAENLKAMRALEVFDATQPLDMAFTAMDGTKIDLAKMRGKVVLVDFWSLSCAPCIKEMPHVQAIYDKYKDQGFNVIGIASNGDDAKEAVEKIQKKTGATWPQRLDKGKDAVVSFKSLFNINSFPTVWLLDKEGKIVDKNARGQRLEPLIRKYLELDNH